MPYSETPATLAGVFALIMTDRHIQFALKKIEAAKKANFHTEAVIKHYALNLALIHYILKILAPQAEIENMKAKAVIKLFMKEVAAHPEMKAVIHKRSLKAVQLWIEKTDAYFKHLKLGQDKPASALLSESEKVFALLKISTNKVFTKVKS